MSAGLAYYDKTVTLINQLKEKELANIDKAAEICTETISNKGLVFLFGAGHSRMMCEEMTPRQGCFPGFFALVEQAVSNHASIVGTNGLRGPLHLEKYEGYAEEILNSFKFSSNDAMIIISSSGIRPLIVEMAVGASNRGLPVIAIVSRQHCDQSEPGHSSGKKLTEVADITIDNQCPPGDCVLELEGLEWRTGPASTVSGAMIINMIRCEVAERLLARGIKPELLPSHQVLGNIKVDEQLDRFYEEYRKSLAHLYR
jgi:uncharacterized phosphosugar-binding protein